jgi:AraC-like DNA-binding protein
MFLYMNLNQITGLNLHSCYHRESLKVLYYNHRFRGTARSTVILMLEGTAYFQFEKARVTGRRGNIISFESESLKNAHGDPKAPPSYLIAAFDLFDRSGSSIGISSLDLPLCFRTKNLSTPRTIMMKMVAQKSRGRQGNLLECARLGLKLLNTIAVEASVRPLSPGREFQEVDERISGILEFLRVHYKKKFSIKSLAERACLHPVYFSRLFKNATGISPHQYILNVKIEKAKIALSGSEEPLLGTGEDLGFSDYSHFYRSFKKTVGMTPSKNLLVFDFGYGTYDVAA